MTEFFQQQSRARGDSEAECVSKTALMRLLLSASRLQRASPQLAYTIGQRCGTMCQGDGEMLCEMGERLTATPWCSCELDSSNRAFSEASRRPSRDPKSTAFNAQLGLILNYSIFLFENIGQKQEAKELAQRINNNCCRKDCLHGAKAPVVVMRIAQLLATEIKQRNEFDIQD
jgi:hypothetical protein